MDEDNKELGSLDASDLAAIGSAVNEQRANREMQSSVIEQLTGDKLCWPATLLNTTLNPTNKYLVFEFQGDDGQKCNVGIYPDVLVQLVERLGRIGLAHGLIAPPSPSVLTNIVPSIPPEFKGEAVAMELQFTNGKQTIIMNADVAAVLPKRIENANNEAGRERLGMPPENTVLH